MTEPAVDLRGELASGDSVRQSRALLAVLGLLSAGRDVSSLVSLICPMILGNAAVLPAIRVTAYEVVAAATPTDSDYVHIARAIAGDIAKGTPAEVRVKALSALQWLPSHRLLEMLREETTRDRLSAMLRNPTSEVKAVAIEAINALTANDAVAARAALDHPTEGVEEEEPPAPATPTSQPENGEGKEPEAPQKHVIPSISELLRDAVSEAAGGLTDDDATVVTSSCSALTAILSSYTGEDVLSALQMDRHSETARALASRSALRQDALHAVDAVFGIALARFRTLPITRMPPVVPFLIQYAKASRLDPQDQPLDALPGDLGAAGAPHVFEETAALLGEQVRGGDPPTVLAAAQGLFELAEDDAASATLQALLPSAINGTMAAALAAGPHQREAAQWGVLSLLLRHLDVLPSVQRAALFSRLPPAIAAVPGAADRVRCLVHLWSAVAAYDWDHNGNNVLFSQVNTRLRTAGPDKTTSVPRLQMLLLDPHIKEAVAGAPPDAASPAGPPPHPRYVDPIFREELVGSLLYVLLTHPRATGNWGVGGTGVIAASSAVTAASDVQDAVEAVEWLVSAKIALQGTKACLGWDRVAGVPTTGTTAAADLWLQLLLRCVHVGRTLREKLGAMKKAKARAGADAAGGSNAPIHPPPEKEPLLDPAQAAFEAAVRRGTELEAELQGLLLQIATNWRALHPVARARAVWLCACHLRLRSVVDGAWGSLADALRGLMIESRRPGDGLPGGSDGFVAAVVEGRLRAQVGAAGRHAASVAAAGGEQEEVALLGLERLAVLVSSNHHGRLVGHLAAVAGLLEKLAGVMGECGVGPAAVDRLKRVQALLGPVATAGKKKQEAKKPEKEAEQNNAVPDIVVAELAPTTTVTASYPSTLPSSASVFTSPEASRYRKFLEQLQSAVLAESVAAAGGVAAASAASAARDTPHGGLPGVLALARALEMGSVSEMDGSFGSGSSIASAAGGVEVTGPSTPVSLTLSHSVDPGAGAVRILCVVANRTMQPLAGVEVMLLAGGPIAGTRRPLTFRLGVLPPGESTSWEVPLLVSGFGWPRVQPGIALPVSVPLGMPSLRCRPYAISPLQLLAPPARAMSPAEFYQRWQAMPYRARLVAAPAEGSGALGVQRVLTAIEAAGLACVMKAVVPVAGGVHAAFHGSAWSGESVAVVVAGGLGGRDRLTLHFGSEAAEVVAHVRGHEEDLLAQLTGGAAVPAAESMASLESATSGTESGQRDEEASGPASTTFSFLKSVTLYMDASSKTAPEGEAEDGAAAAATRRETYLLHAAAVDRWARVRAARVA